MEVMTSRANWVFSGCCSLGAQPLLCSQGVKQVASLYLETDMGEGSFFFSRFPQGSDSGYK